MKLKEIGHQQKQKCFYHIKEFLKIKVGLLNEMIYHMLQIRNKERLKNGKETMEY